MKIGEILDAITELKENGYPIDDSTDVAFDLDLRKKTELMKFTFEDKGLLITVVKEM